MDNFPCIYDETTREFHSFDGRDKAVGFLLSQGVNFHSAVDAVDNSAWMMETMVKGHKTGHWYTVTISSLTYHNGEAL